ncbi:MAG: hypothetical protein JRJ15_09855, partial [Deltaproteobacteria bacterium]|nr:hypothetical protein [Deltaproteobacteria bacterium]
SIMMGHARPYYGSRMEEQGYQKEKDLLAYIVQIGFALPSFAQKLMARTTQDLRVRPLRKSRFSEDLEILQDLYEDAWSQNWGFIPFTRAEFKQLGNGIKLLANERFVQIAEVDGNAAAMIVVVPNINEAIRDLNGRLFPFRWLKLLWRLKVDHPHSARVLGARAGIYGHRCCVRPCCKPRHPGSGDVLDTRGQHGDAKDHRIHRWHGIQTISNLWERTDLKAVFGVP